MRQNREHKIKLDRRTRIVPVDGVEARAGSGFTQFTMPR